MSRITGPPAYAWDWFARQRLLWREVHRRLSHPAESASVRYAGLDGKSDVLTVLRADYPRDDTVRRVVQAAVREVVFLDRTDVPFERLGVRTPPRGMRWWWTALTGEAVEPGRPAPVTAGPSQLTLDDVHEGYGD